MSKLYIAFIRATVEYASIVWDVCSAHDIEMLEKVRLSAARIVTGLPIFTSRESLYTEKIGKLYKLDVTLQKWFQCTKFTMAVLHLTLLK